MSVPRSGSWSIRSSTPRTLLERAGRENSASVVRGVMAPQQRSASPPATGCVERGNDLESAFSASKAATAAFRFDGSPPEVHGRRAVVHEPPSSGWPWRTVPGLTDPEISSVELGAVEFLDRLGDRCRIPELDEGESTRSIGDAVDRKKDFRDLTHFSEQGFEICLRGLVAEVTDEDS